MMDLKTVYATTRTLARQAGEVLLRYYEQPHQEEGKSTVLDIVTEADKAAESFLVEALRTQFPDHHIVGEEGGGRGAPADEAAYFWYVDPVDGTANFANNLPLFCVSLGLADREQTPLVGAVFNPASDELYSAVRGGGATMNDRALHVSSRDTLAQSIVGTGFPPDRRGTSLDNLEHWRNFTLRTRGTRRLGSAALDLCFVAMGRLDGFWEPQLNRWDYMAGMLIVQEAGGQVTDFVGGHERLLNSGELLASNGHIHAAMIATLQDDGS
jgi:myo-inositol-1(or 4)-monophosphatase